MGNNILNWNDYNSWNRRSFDLRMAWLSELKVWLLNNLPLTKESNLEILDYGCGHFDLGFWLQDMGMRVDGYDPHKESLSEAIKRNSNLSSQFFSNIKEIPPKSYDVIVLHSVLQYFSHTNDIDELFSNTQVWLKDKGLLLITDIIPESYRPLRAVVKSALFSLKKHFFISWVVHIWKATFKPKNLKLLKIDFDQLKKLSDKYGFENVKMASNLSPADQRYSVLIKKTL